MNMNICIEKDYKMPDLEDLAKVPCSTGRIYRSINITEREGLKESSLTNETPGD